MGATGSGLDHCIKPELSSHARGGLRENLPVTADLDFWLVNDTFVDVLAYLDRQREEQREGYSAVSHRVDFESS